MSYSEDDILRPDEWPAAGPGTWNRRHSQSSKQWPAAGMYATVNRPPPPAKPLFLTSGSMSRNSVQAHHSHSQHHLNYAPVAGDMAYQQPSSGSSHRKQQSQHHNDGSYQHPPAYSRIFRRFSETDEPTAFYYLPAANNAHSSAHPSPPSSTSSSFKPVTTGVHHAPLLKPDLRPKPVPPPKPPRSALEQNDSLNRNLIQSKSQRNLAAAWNKTFEFGDVPPPEGYGNNIKRSASNDVEGFLTTFGGYTKGSLNRKPIEHENAHTRLLNDGYGTDHLYDEISSNGRACVSNGDNGVIATNKIYATPHQRHSYTPAPREQQLQPQQAALQQPQASHKHLRSRSEHHPRCPNSSNHYEAPFKLRNLSVERISDQPNGRSVPDPPPDPPVVVPAVRRVSSHDEYATVLHPPPPDVALRTIRSVIKPLQKEYRLIKQLSGRSVGTRIEPHLFAIFDSKGQKVSVKAKTLDRIPLLRDMATLTDPVPDDFFAPRDNNTLSASHYGSSKLSSDDGKRSLRRIKHPQTFHLGTAERRKKKSMHKSQDQINRTASDVNSLPNGAEQGKASPVVVIKPIDIDIESEKPPESQPQSGPASSAIPFADRKDWADIESLMALFESAFNSNGQSAV